MNRVHLLPSLDAHAHFRPGRTPAELAPAGAVLAMTGSLDEAAQAVGRRDALVAWGVGCHPRVPRAQAGFDRDRFAGLVARTAIIGEIGLDSGARIPLDTQLRTFRAALEVVAELPRVVSIHSYRATGLVLEELRRRPVAVPVLHWWTGTAPETRLAVSLGCYFSVHSQVARRSQFRTAVPAERVLVESDHGWADPPAAIPCRVEWVEHLMGQQLRLDAAQVRRLAWRNLGALVDQTGVRELLPPGMAAILDRVAAETVPPVAKQMPLPTG